jgi:hypothetical protein
MNEEQKKKIPPDSHYVRFIKNGYLYVETDGDNVIKIENTLGDKVTNYVYLKKTDKGYNISLKPFRRGKKN